MACNILTRHHTKDCVKGPPPISNVRHRALAFSSFLLSLSSTVDAEELYALMHIIVCSVSPPNTIYKQ